jgi:hypothetical protein
MRITTCLILTLVLVSFLYAAETVWFEGTFDEMKAEAQKQGKLLAIDFSSDT